VYSRENEQILPFHYIKFLHTIVEALKFWLRLALLISQDLIPHRFLA